MRTFIDEAAGVPNGAHDDQCDAMSQALNRLILAPLLACWRPRRLLSSPWRRCLETVAPFADGATLRVRTKNSFSEAGAGRSPARTRRQVQRLLDA